jgi:hypothetical protein
VIKVRKGRIVRYVNLSLISKVVLNDIIHRIGVKNVNDIGYGAGPYAKCPLIVVTEQGTKYKYSVDGNVYILKRNKWVKVGRYVK